ncbi:MAG: NAD(P)-dependent glycerol-3-phosphate dehydrogenase [Candidatus Firestonebacteria bacterium]|nr:NAD(P)-dependent glycerol-3-phosphate dehydrogenase [Candidatus Firestonebacteria bacterium]
MKSTPVAVIGAGAWGTTLAMILNRRGLAVRLWEFFPEYARVLDLTRENPKFLPGVQIAADIEITSDLNRAVEGCRNLVMVVPSQRMRSVAHRLAAGGYQPEVVVSASKGIEQDSLLRMSEVLVAEFGEKIETCALSGPSHAEEVSRNLPSTLVAASRNKEVAQRVQDWFMGPSVRVYTSEDIVGVELGGSLKNVIALASGVVDGLGLGDNAKAALITRGLAEIIRLGKALGARTETFSGLSGLGDLVVTCMSQHSRNRRVGEELGRGKKLKEILSNMEMVAEGVDTSRSAFMLAKRLGVEMPITEQMNRVLFEDVRPADALSELMLRARKEERDDAP